MIIYPITNILFTKGENLSTTQLPIWEIQLSGRKLAALNSDLPASGRIYQSGTVIINSASFPARIRYRGGFFQWTSKQKSWKIELKGGQRFEGKREFNLVNPRLATTLIWPLFSHIAQSMGLKTPRLQHVHARLNGQYLGVLLLLENFDHDFTAQNGLPEGALYGDEALGVYHHYSWEEIETWSIREPGSKRKHQAGKNPKEKYESYLNELLSCLDLKNDKVFFHTLEELVDINHYLKWWACAIICFDTHQDRKHNNRLYLDPTSGKFRPIPWDMSKQWRTNPKREIDLNLNPLTERLLQLPEYIHDRNRIIWEAIQGPANADKIIQWLDEMAGLIREDIYCDSHKDALFLISSPLKSIRLAKMERSIFILPVTNGMFERKLKELKNFLLKRVAYLRQELSKTEAKLVFNSTSHPDVAVSSHYISEGQLNIQVDGQEGIIVKEIRIHLKSAFPLVNTPFLFYGSGSRLIKRIGEKVHNLSSGDREVYTFKIDELLLPGRKREPPFTPTPFRYPFAIAFINSKGTLPDLLEAEIRGVHPLTNREILFKTPLSELRADLPTIPMGKFQPLSSSPREIIWEGIKRIEKDFRVARDEMLVIRPGTRIELSEGTSLLSYGRVTAVGTATSPIVFTRAPGSASWGVVALQGSGASGSMFEHCTFEYGSDDELSRVFYSGALSIYNADTTIKNCLFRFNQGDDALNTKFSSTDVFQTHFISNKADAYDLDFSQGLIVGSIFEENGNDGIDCGMAHPRIKDNRIVSCGDKGISIGERSNPVVEDNLIAHCKVGIAVKDQSCPKIRRNEFQFNKIAVEAYQKKKVFGGADVVIHESKFQNNESISKSDEVSSINLVDCSVDGKLFGEDN